MVDHVRVITATASDEAAPLLHTHPEIADLERALDSLASDDPPLLEIFIHGLEHPLYLRGIESIEMGTESG